MNLKEILSINQICIKNDITFDEYFYLYSLYQPKEFQYQSLPSNLNISFTKLVEKRFILINKISYILTLDGKVLFELPAHLKDKIWNKFIEILNLYGDKDNQGMLVFYINQQATPALLGDKSIIGYRNSDEMKDTLFFDILENGNTIKAKLFLENSYNYFKENKRLTMKVSTYLQNYNSLFNN